jgi:hypothetical protein
MSNTPQLQQLRLKKVKLILTPQFLWSNKRCALPAVILSLFFCKWHWLYKKCFGLIFYPLPLAPLFPSWMPTPTRSTHKLKDPKTRVLSWPFFLWFLFCIDHEIIGTGLGRNGVTAMGFGGQGAAGMGDIWLGAGVVGAAWVRSNMVWAPLGTF